jgi:hypothetical protein
VNTINAMNNQLESTYNLLVRSEEKGRGFLEIAVFAASILSVVFTIYQFAQTPVTSPAPGTKACVACQINKPELHAHS